MVPIEVETVWILLGPDQYKNSVLNSEQQYTLSTYWGTSQLFSNQLGGALAQTPQQQPNAMCPSYVGQQNARAGTYSPLCCMQCVFVC